MRRISEVPAPIWLRPAVRLRGLLNPRFAQVSLAELAHAHHIESANNSRPISILRISDVPAPIWLRPLALARLTFAALTSASTESGPYIESVNSSRPISIRLISDVPAPISYSLASRHRRPVG